MIDDTIDKLPIVQMVGPAAVIDLRPLGLGAGEQAGAEAVLDWEQRNGPIRRGEIALLNFGWGDRFWFKDERWRELSTNSPGLREDAVRLLYERGIKALGSDLMACDQAIKDGVALKSYAHEVYMLPKHIPLIEGLTNLHRLPPRCFFMALPLKIAGGSGSPIRAAAIVPRSS